MSLVTPFALVIVATVAMMLIAMYVGGGADAIRRQLPVVVVFVGALVALAAVIYVVVAVLDGALLMGIVASVASAVASALLAMEARGYEREGVRRLLVPAMWVLAAVFVALAALGLLLQLA